MKERLNSLHLENYHNPEGIRIVDGYQAERVNEEPGFKVSLENLASLAGDLTVFNNAAIYADESIEYQDLE